jgi:hypothetical protein
LLGAYSRAGTTSVKAVVKTAVVIAVAAEHGGKRQGTAVIQSEGKMPGPVERRLVELGVTSPDILERGAAIDQSARQLINEAAQETARQRWHAAVAGQKAVADTSKITGQLLAPPRPRAPSPRHLRPARPDSELEAGH